MAEIVSVNDFSTHGQGNLMDNIFLGEQDMIGTIFFRPTEALTEKTFFTLGNDVSPSYQNVTFPINSASAYDAKVVLAQHNFRFDVTTSYDAALQQIALMEFEQATRIIVDQDKRTGVLEVSLADLLPYTWAVTASAAGVTSYTQIAKAFPSFQLTQILQLGFAQKIKVRMVPPTGLVFPAYAAAITPLIPGTGVLPAVSGTSTPADRGYSITIRFKSIEQVRKT